MKILLAVDGSSQSRDAVRSLAHFAPSDELTLVHAMVLPDLDHPMITPELRDQVVKELEEKLRQDGEALLDHTQSDIPSDFPAVRRVHQIGSPAHVIVETAQSAKSDLIILGARGMGPVKEVVLGSVSHRVVLHAPCSILVQKTPLQRIQNILLPLEGENDTEEALTFLATNPFRPPVNIEVMAVWPQPQVPWPISLGQSKMMEDRAIEHAQDRLDGITQRLATMNYQSTSTVGMGDPAYAILEQARMRKPDLIMMGSHGRTGLSRFLLGSVSHTVLHRADCPVLIVR